MSANKFANIVEHIRKNKYYTSAPGAPFKLLEHTNEFAQLEQEAIAEDILPSQKLELIIAGLRDISTTADRITSGNIAHHRLSIKAIADKLTEILADA